MQRRECLHRNTNELNQQQQKAERKHRPRSRGSRGQHEGCVQWGAAVWGVKGAEELPGVQGGGNAVQNAECKMRSVSSSLPGLLFLTGRAAMRASQWTEAFHSPWSGSVAPQCCPAGQNEGTRSEQRHEGGSSRGEMGVGGTQRCICLEFGTFLVCRVTKQSPW